MQCFIGSSCQRGRWGAGLAGDLVCCFLTSKPAFPSQVLVSLHGVGEGANIPPQLPCWRAEVGWDGCGHVPLCGDRGDLGKTDFQTWNSSSWASLVMNSSGLRSLLPVVVEEWKCHWEAQEVCQELVCRTSALWLTLAFPAATWEQLQKEHRRPMRRL